MSEIFEIDSFQTLKVTTIFIIDYAHYKGFYVSQKLKIYQAFQGIQIMLTINCFLFGTKKEFEKKTPPPPLLKKTYTRHISHYDYDFP